MPKLISDSVMVSLLLGQIPGWLDAPVVSIHQGLGMPHVLGSIPNQSYFTKNII